MLKKVLLSAVLAVLLCGMVCAALLLWVELSAQPYISAGSEAPQAQAAIVLGASVISTSTLSGVLEERADAALELYRAGVVKKILVTGDNSTPTHNEVDPVATYLEARGVPREDVFLDRAGLDTYSSMHRAQAVFNVRSALIVSQAFHLPRAVFIARALGIDAHGIVAGSGDNPFLFNRVREAPATLKALFDVATARVPLHLGPKVPIEGSGTTTQPALQ